MGTNVYLHHDVCTCCGRPGAVVHIGKSSAGWVWLWRGYRGFEAEDLPFGREITSGDDWWEVLAGSLGGERLGRIVDEYGTTYTLDALRYWVARKRRAGRRGKRYVPFAGGVLMDTETYPDGPDDISFREFA
ncbi:MAG: hypothetical protein ABR549_15620 [Mycobacteriales bacterium]